MSDEVTSHQKRVGIIHDVCGGKIEELLAYSLLHHRHTDRTYLPTDNHKIHIIQYQQVQHKHSTTQRFRSQNRI